MDKNNEQRLGDLRKGLYEWLERQGFTIDEGRHAVIKIFCGNYAALAKKEVLDQNKHIFDFYATQKGRKQ